MKKYLRKTIFCIVSIFLCVVLLETISYIIVKFFLAKPENKRKWYEYYKNSGLYKDDIDLSVLYNEQKNIWSNVTFDFFRYYRPLVNFEGKYISTDQDGFRKTIQHFKDRKLKNKVIIFLGGSTMWGGGGCWGF